jgi:hypothetical protein
VLARKLWRVLMRNLRRELVRNLWLVAAEGWAAVAVGLLSAEVAVTVLLAGLVSGAVVGLEVGAQEVVVGEARSPRRRCITARRR